MRDLLALPKVDLHVHLQGSVRPATVLDLARRNGVEPPPHVDDRSYGPYADFDDFISRYILTCRCIRTTGDLRRIAVEFAEDAAAQGVRYAEVTFTVLGHDIEGDARSPVAAVLDGFEEGYERFGTRCRLVLDCVRGWVEEAAATLDAAIALRDRGVVALGLGGNERHPGAPFAPFFRRAADEGLRSVPHAGEAAGPASIREAVDLLGAERIGHGIRVLEDDDLVAELRERRTALEVCPSSNVSTGVVASIEDHPLPRLLDAGLRVTINSDDPAMFGSTLVGEYEVARRIFGLDDAALAALARSAVDASFADDGTKAEIEDAVDRWLEEDG